MTDEHQLALGQRSAEYPEYVNGRFIFNDTAALVRSSHEILLVKEKVAGDIFERIAIDK